MLLLKMLQPDEGIGSGEDTLGSCQSLRRQQACALMCGPQEEIYCAKLMLYLHRDDKVAPYPKGSFL